MKRRLTRYLAVGVLATAAHWSLLALLVETGAAPAWLGSGAGALLGAQVAFFGNRRFTFGHDGELAPAWWRFMTTAAAGGLVNMGVVGAGVALGLHYLLAQAVATGTVVFATFLVNHHWTFAK